MQSSKKLYLLKREISPYSGENLFLGIYDNPKLAQKGKDKYFEFCKILDKWQEQAYREVDLEKDVEIIELQEQQSEESFPKEGQSIYLVSGIVEAFGQIIKKLLFVSINKAMVMKFIQTKEEEDHPEDEFAYYKYEVLKLNDLFFSN